MVSSISAEYYQFATKQMTLPKLGSDKSYVYIYASLLLDNAHSMWGISAKLETKRVMLYLVSRQDQACY